MRTDGLETSLFRCEHEEADSRKVEAVSTDDASQPQMIETTSSVKAVEQAEEKRTQKEKKQQRRRRQNPEFH